MTDPIKNLPTIEQLVFRASTSAPADIVELAEQVRRELYEKDDLIQQLDDRVKWHSKRATAAEDRIRYVQNYLEDHFEEYQ